MKEYLLRIVGALLIIVGVILLFVPILPGLVPIWIGFGMTFPKHRQAMREKVARLFRKQ